MENGTISGAREIVFPCFSMHFPSVHHLWLKSFDGGRKLPYISCLIQGISGHFKNKVVVATNVTQASEC